eukprot:jgi/Bigna1/145715/aug1.102_g20423
MPNQDTVKIITVVFQQAYNVLQLNRPTSTNPKRSMQWVNVFIQTSAFFWFLCFSEHVDHRWQAQLVFGAVIVIFGSYLGLYSTYISLSAMYTSVNLSSAKLPQQLGFYFKSFGLILLALQILAVIGTLITATNRINALRHAATILLIIFLFIMAEPAWIKLRMLIDELHKGTIAENICDTKSSNERISRSKQNDAHNTKTNGVKVPTTENPVLMECVDSKRSDNPGSLKLEYSSVSTKSQKIVTSSPTNGDRRSALKSQKNIQMNRTRQKLTRLIFIVPIMGATAVILLAIVVFRQYTRGGSYSQDTDEESNQYSPLSDLIDYCVIFVTMYFQFYAHSRFPKWFEIFLDRIAAYYPYQ